MYHDDGTIMVQHQNFDAVGIRVGSITDDFKSSVRASSLSQDTQR